MIILTIDKKNKMCTFKSMIRLVKFLKNKENYDQK